MVLDILLPYWGDPALLHATVDSVIAQRNPNWKLTIVDDAYPDETVGERYRDHADERIRYVRHPENVGITENYRRSLGLATEPVLVFLGCDDLMHPNYVDVVLAAHEAHPNAAIIQPGVRVIDEHGTPIHTLVDRVKGRIAPRPDRPVELRGEDLAVSLLRGNWLYWPSLAFLRERIERFEFRAGLPLVQDLALVLDMVYAGESVLVEPTECFSYRRHSASASGANLIEGRRFGDDRRYFAIAADQARTHGWRRAERAARLRLTSRAHALSLLPGALVRGRVSAARPLLQHALQRTPSVPKEPS